MRRRFVSKQEEEKKQKKNQRLLGIILVVVMFGSVFGVIVNSFNSRSEEEKIIFNGMEVVRQGSFYLMTIGDKTFAFSENPVELEDELESVNITKIIPMFVGKPFYIDSVDYYATQELYQNLQGYPQRIQMACLEESDCIDESLPIKDCANNIVVIKEAEESKVYENESCIFIEGKKEDLVKLTDAFLLKVIGLN